MFPNQADQAPRDCQSCGACCFSGAERYVRVTGSDYSRMGASVDTYVHFLENRAYMRMTDGHCAALVVLGAGRYACQLYDTRPTICRELQRGSPECAGERHVKLALISAVLRT